MATASTKYSYLVAVMVYFPDTGMNITASVDVDINFRITKDTVPILLGVIREMMAKDTYAGQKLPKGVVMKITAFSRYDEE